MYVFIFIFMHFVYVHFVNWTRISLCLSLVILGTTVCPNWFYDVAKLLDTYEKTCQMSVGFGFVFLLLLTTTTTATRICQKEM